MKQQNNHYQWLIRRIKHNKRLLDTILSVFISRPVISIDDRKDLRNSMVVVKIAVNEIGLLDSEVGYRRKHY